MAHERSGKHGQLDDPLISQESARNAQIGEVQGNLLQPANSWLEVTVLRAHNLPRLKNLFGKKRRFYAAVTDGTTTNSRKTAAIRSVGQAVEWNEKLDAFAVPISSRLTLSLYAQERMGQDQLIGTLEIPLESGNDISFAINSIDTAQPVTLVLTINISVNPQSPATAPPNAPNVVALKPTKPISAPADSQVEALSAEKALHGADNAMKMEKLHTKWGNTIKRVQWVMNTVSPVAELHPYAKMAWGLLSMIPKTFLEQVQRDGDIEDLLDAMHDAFEFTEEAAPVTNFNPQSKQARILVLILRQVCTCGDFIKAYGQDKEFRNRLLKNVTGSVNKRISDLSTKFVELKRAFLDHAAITTEITVLEILDDVGMLSSKISDLDLDEKLREIPYRAYWRSDANRGCLLGTRTDFLDHIVQWVDNPNSERGLVLVGQAGTGKSSIASEIAQRFQDMNRLSSYFAFRRVERSKREDYLLFTTIVHDLSNRYPSFKRALGKAIKDNKPLRAAQDYHTLFESLLLQPLKEVHIVGPILIIIDALDESGDVARKDDGLHTFLARCLARLADLPLNFRILITSRPEPGIMHAFPDVSGALYQIVQMDDPKLAARTTDDILIYLQKNLLLDMFEQHGNALVKKAEGLFQWAVVA